MKIIITSILLLLSLYVCSQTEKKEESLIKEMIESSIKQDTLSIVSTADYLYYPFNKTVEPALYFSNVKSEIQNNNGIYLLDYKNSFLRLVLSDETGILEIVEGKIVDENILLNDYIHVNMSKSDFASYFGLQLDNTIHVVEMVSGLLGIWHYYYFKNDVLDCIYIKSDYIF
ncbi:MAG: hypothetical protein PHE03_13345 [Bacteroidales bacterium]|nr:hypothetical protein [Bacteroidales bacterium]